MTITAQSDLDRWLTTSLGAVGPDETRLASTHPNMGAGTISDARALRSKPRERLWRRDHERLLTDPAITRLEGVTQVLPPNGSVSSRLSHSRTVARLASVIAGRLGLNPDLAAAIGIAHDCGHAPYGHAGENSIREYEPAFSHARWGADKVLADRGYSVEVRDGVRSHSWSGDDCRTPEAEIVRWADRIAYLTEDLADAFERKLVFEEGVPCRVRREIGIACGEQQRALTSAVISASRGAGRICMRGREAEVMAELRRFNAVAIYQHPDVTAANLSGAEHIRGAIAVIHASSKRSSDTISQLVALTDAQTTQIAQSAGAATDAQQFRSEMPVRGERVPDLRSGSRSPAV